MQPQHWVELHAFFNHLPFAFLIAVPLFEIGAIIFHKPEWRVVSFWLLVGAAVALIPTIPTGWISADKLNYTGGVGTPSVFEWHKYLALLTAALTAVLLIWRVMTHDKLRKTALYGSVAFTVVIGIVVSAVGYLGGKMVINPAGRSSDFVPITEATKAEKVAIPDVDPKLVKKGGVLFHSLPCIGCHTMNGKGGKVGPDLTHEARRHNNMQWHIEHLKDPGKFFPNADMPSFKQLKPGELRALAAYLATRK